MERSRTSNCTWNCLLQQSASRHFQPRILFLRTLFAIQRDEEMNSFQTVFTNDLILVLVLYLDSDDIVEFLCSCKIWYQELMKRYARKLIYRDFDSLNVDEVIRKNQALVCNPLRQISIFIEDYEFLPSINTFITSLNNALQTLQCTAKQFCEIMRSTDSLHVNKLSIAWHMIDEPLTESSALFLALAKVSDCEELKLRYHDYNRPNPITIPTISGLKFLSLAGYTNVEMTILAYINTLNHLCLSHCTITDVSLLGSIPHLELLFCYNLRDISTLNNNDHIVVEECRNIHDYAHSFANSRKIEVILSGGNTYLFDLSKWLKVEELLLLDNYNEETEIYFTNNKLPSTVIKCDLSESFVVAVDCSSGRLNRLSLSSDYSLTDLSRYPLKDIAILDLHNLQSVESLEGLRNGKIRKVIISYCDNITDFSPLNQIPIVYIRGCNNFTDPFQVRNVRDLTLGLIKDVSFHSNLKSPFENIQSLKILNSERVRMFDGLEKISFLQMDSKGFDLIKHFLEEGKQLENKRIVLVFPRNDDVDFLELHHQYFSDNYDYYNNLPKRWIWSRNEVID